MQSYEIIEQGQQLDKASKALILLHGRGGTAFDLLSLANEFTDDSFYIAALQAPNNSWYPLSFMAEEKLNETSISASVEAIIQIIEKAARFIPKSQIYLMGFSQGACLALETSARHADKYGGIIAFTGGLIGSIINEKKYNGNFEGTTVFIGISDKDPYIPLVRADQSKELMEKMGAKVTLKVYEGTSHNISKDEINWVKKNIFNEMSK